MLPPAFSYKHAVLGLTLLFSAGVALADGGISIDRTRVIYPLHSRQESVRVTNSAAADSFLIQSWVEGPDGKKSPDFIVTPPLYLSGPGNENLLRLVRAGGQPPATREALYYLVVKAIPSRERTTGADRAGSASVSLALATRIKLFVRPEGLTTSPSGAPAALLFRRDGGALRITNPTPFHVTLTEMALGGKAVKSTMVPPASSVTVPLPAGAAGDALTWRAINDYGGLTAPVTTQVGRRP